MSQDVPAREARYKKFLEPIRCVIDLLFGASRIVRYRAMMETLLSLPPSLLPTPSDLALNWNVDVAKELEEYLEDLDGISISFDGGKTSLNFAEAAILIQGSAVVYSRKVEYLYSLIYQALDVLSAKSEWGGAGYYNERARELQNCTRAHTRRCSKKNSMIETYYSPRFVALTAAISPLPHPLFLPAHP
jgi:hypothetical protein